MTNNKLNDLIDLCVIYHIHLKYIFQKYRSGFMTRSDFEYQRLKTKAQIKKTLQSILSHNIQDFGIDLKEYGLSPS